jgi:hypothetical protein
MRIEYTPVGPVSDAFYYDDSFVSGIRGPIGSGKSTAAAFRPFRHLFQSEPDRNGNRRARWAIIRNTYPELKTTTIKTWHQWFPKEMGTWQEEGPPTHWIRGGGLDLEVMFLALDRPDDVRKLLSLELTGAWINEAREASKAILDGLTGRVGRFPPAKSAAKGWSGIILDTNPPDTDHWWYRLAEEDKPEGFKFFSQPACDGPDGENLENLPPGYYERAKAGKDPEWIKVYVRGEYGFVQDGKPVYPEFRETLHLADVEYVDKWPLHIGMDFGLTPAAVFGQVSPTGAWRWIDELVCEDAGAKQFGELLAAKVRRDYPHATIGSLTGDPAGIGRGAGDSEQTVFQIFNAAASKARLVARPAPTNDFTMRREAVAIPMGRIIDGEPGLRIGPKCRLLRKSMAGGYRYKRVQVSGSDRFQDKPDKNHFSHVAEAGQYLMLGGGEGRVIVRRDNDGKSRVTAENYNPLDGIPTRDNPAGGHEFDPLG